VSNLLLPAVGLEVKQQTLQLQLGSTDMQAAAAAAAAAGGTGSSDPAAAALHTTTGMDIDSSSSDPQQQQQQQQHEWSALGGIRSTVQHMLRVRPRSSSVGGGSSSGGQQPQQRKLVGLLCCEQLGGVLQESVGRMVGSQHKWLDLTEQGLKSLVSGLLLVVCWWQLFGLQSLAFGRLGE
jgi:hypothetical protein